MRKIKQGLIAVLCLLLFVCGNGMMVFAETDEETVYETEPERATGRASDPYVVKSGSTASSGKYTLYSNGELVISGTGTIGGDRPWDSYATSVKTPIIEEGITGLQYQAFYNCTNLTSISFPTTLK